MIDFLIIAGIIAFAVIAIGMVGYFLRCRKMQKQGITRDEDLAAVGVAATEKVQNVRKKFKSEKKRNEEEKDAYFYWIDKSLKEDNKDNNEYKEVKIMEPKEEPELYVAQEKPIKEKKQRGQWMKDYHQYLVSQKVLPMGEFIRKRKAGEI